MAQYPFAHVTGVPDLGIWDPGATRGRKAKDKEIVPWCHKHGHILVTCDTDFRSAEMRETLLRESRVEVLWFKKQPKGVREQTEQIVKHYRTWDEELGKQHPAYRQWMQPPHGRIKKMKR